MTFCGHPSQQGCLTTTFCTHVRWSLHRKYEEATRKELQQLACREEFLKNALAMLQAQRHIIQLYLTGKLSKDEEPPEPSMVPRALQVEEEAPPRDPRQQKLELAINTTVDKALQLRAAAMNNEANEDKLSAEMAEDNRILICTGPPGCGKSFVAESVSSKDPWKAWQHRD